MLKRKCESLINRPASEAIKLAPDPFFDSDDDDDGFSTTRLKRKPKLPRASGPVAPGEDGSALAGSSQTAAPKPPKPPKKTSRLQTCGAKDMDRAACAAQDNGPHVRVVFFHLSPLQYADGFDGSGFEHVLCKDRRGARYDLYPSWEKDQTVLGESEFIGFFYSGDVDEPGVADEIIDALQQNDQTHVIIVDKKGTEFCRLLAGIVIAKLKKRDARMAAELKDGLKRPIAKEWKETLDKVLKAKTELLMRPLAREVYETLP